MCGNGWGSQKQGEHRVLLTQIMHLLAATAAPGGLAALTGRVARPYNICVGANSMFALARNTNGTDGATT
jgi:putative copper export protein